MGLQLVIYQEYNLLVYFWNYFLRFILYQLGFNQSKIDRDNNLDLVEISLSQKTEDELLDVENFVF